MTVEAGDRGTTIHLGVIHFNSQVMGRRCRFLRKCFIFVLWSVPIFIFIFFLTHLCWNITEFKSASRVPDERGRQRERNPEKENIPSRPVAYFRFINGTRGLCQDMAVQENLGTQETAPKV